MSVSEWLETEFDRICEEIEAEDSTEVVGPQSELDLGVEASICVDEPPVEVPGVVPTVEVEEGDSSVEILISTKEIKKDQAEGTGTKPVPEDAMLRREGQAVGTGEPILDVDRSGEEPDLMDVDSVVRAGEVPVREILETGTGAVSVPEKADERTGSENVLKEAGEDTGAMPFRETGEGDLCFEDYPGDDFEKVREFTPEVTSHTPPAPVPE